MAKKREFTDEQLKEMGTRTLDVLTAAIESGDKDKALKLSKRMYREFEAMHDLFVKWIASNYNYVYQKYGDEGLSEALRQSCSPWLKELVQIYSGKDPKRVFEILVMGLRGHLQGFKIEEDDEKFTIYFDPCGSGGRLVQSGAYEPPTSFARIKKAQAMTYGIPNYPVYCAHCTFQEMVPIEMTGKPIFITEPVGEPGKAPCKVYIFKDPEKIPEKFYQKVGKKKSQGTAPSE